MEALFSQQFVPLWALILAVLLFFPVRRLIWVLYMRRAMRGGEVEDAEQARLRRRAGVTSALLCFVFAVLYTTYLFGSVP